VPWGPSHQWADSSLRLHTFATVLGLELVSLARLALGTTTSPRRMMQTLAALHTTLVTVRRPGRGRRPTVMLAPDLSVDQRRAARTFDLERWMPGLLSSMSSHAVDPGNRPAE
jgi:hypothetical protein